MQNELDKVRTEKDYFAPARYEQHLQC